LRGGLQFRRDLRGPGFDGLLADRHLGGRGRLYQRLGSFLINRWLFGLGDFNPAGATADDIGAHPARGDRLARLNLAQRFVFRLHHTVRDNLFLAHVDLRFLLHRQGGADSRDLIVFEGALRLAPSDSQPVEVGDEILGLNRQFFR
jgi:hypothetical protein